MKKKAQSEIVGLMIIVVIITIGMLFYLSYATIQSEENTNDNIRKEFVDNELSMSFVQTLIRTNVEDCNNLPLDLLIKECGLNREIIDCGGIPPCSIVEEVLISVRAETLEKWDRYYFLAIDYGKTSVKGVVDLGTGDNCKPGTTVGIRAPGIQPIPYYPESGTAYLQLALCNK